MLEFCWFLYIHNYTYLIIFDIIFKILKLLIFNRILFENIHCKQISITKEYVCTKFSRGREKTISRKNSEIFSAGTKCHKVSQGVTKCHKMSQNVTKCHKMSKMSQNVTKRLLNSHVIGLRGKPVPRVTKLQTPKLPNLPDLTLQTFNS